ncbi:MAG TPA: hypothetical protein VGL02_28135 [Streptomyces sp.]
MSLLCAECVMRFRLDNIQQTGFDVTPNHLTYLENAEAVVLIQGTALCSEHLLECVQIQRQSGLVAPNGSQFVTPQVGPR